MQKTIAVDFDGVLHRYSKGFQDGSIYDSPVEGAIECMIALREAGCILIIHSVRACGIPEERKPGQRAEIAQWLTKHNIPWDEISISGKPHADLYVDDKGYRFTGWDAFEVGDMIVMAEE